MPVTFPGGQAVPAQGTEAYKAAQTGSGNGSYNPTTGVLSTGQGSVLTPLYTPPGVGGQTATTPVVTANAAQADYTSKKASFDAINQQIQMQGFAQLQNKQIEDQNKAAKEIRDSEMKLKQQGVDIQKQTADTQAAEAKTKQDALLMASGQQNNTQQVPPGWDQTTYNNFKKSNPGIEPNAEDTARMNGASSGDIASNGIQDATKQFQQGNSEIQSQKDTLAGQSINLLDQVMKGTIPLSAPQQALITGLQQQLQTNEAYQRIANQAYEGAVTTAAFRSGGEYTPEQMAGKIHNAISTGVSKIQELDNNAAVTIAKLEQEFQKNNYDVINKQYDILTKQLDDKSNAIKDTYSATVSSLKDLRDYEQKKTDSVNKIVEEAAKNGASPDVLALIGKSESESQAITSAGNWLQSGSGQIGEYLQYKRDAESKGLTPHDYQSWKDSEANKESSRKINESVAINNAKQISDSKFTSSDKNQQKLEQQYRQVLSKEFSSRTGALGVENAKVNQANHLNSLITQYYDPKTGDYNVPKSQYGELVLGLANLISPTSVASDSLRQEINTRTAKGDIAGALSYVTGQPQNGSTQAIIKNFIDSIDRQAETAVRNRESALKNMRDQAPTDLDQSRIDALNKSTQMVKFEGQERISKSNVNKYVLSNPSEKESVAKLYEVPGATDQDIESYLKAQGKI